MKRTGVVLCLSVLMLIMAGTFCFAEGNFKLVSSYPEDGATGFQPVNMAIKLYFSEDVTSGAAQEANQDVFSLVDESGEKIDITAVYNENKDPNYILVYVNGTLESDKEYTLTIADSLVSSAGEALGKTETISFQTRNTGTDSTVSMMFMVVMMVAMIGLMAWDTRRQAKKAEEQEEPEEKFNPYKVAKETGKSVEEVVAEHEKKMAREAKRYARKRSQDDVSDEEEEDDEPRPGVYRVSVRKSMKSVGGKVPKSVLVKHETRQKKLAEAKARAERVVRNKGKGKGSKQHQKKKK